MHESLSGKKEALLLSAGDLALAASIRLGARQRLSGFALGEQRSPGTGSGIEFADYREYSPGDDTRALDWNLFLRFRKLMVKQAAEEKELTLAVFLDASRSMDSGRVNKLLWARKLAAIIASSALMNGNRAVLSLMGKSLINAIPAERGKLPLTELLETLMKIQPQEEVNPVLSARQFASSYSGKSLVLVLSDFLFPEWEEFIASLGRSGRETIAVQILSADEINPVIAGEALLRDSENGEELPVFADPGTLKLYRKKLDAHIAGVGAAAARYGIYHVRAESGSDMTELIKGKLSGRSYIW